jgi:hypothetical protein
MRTPNGPGTVAFGTTAKHPNAAKMIAGRPATALAGVSPQISELQSAWLTRFCPPRPEIVQEKRNVQYRANPVHQNIHPKKQRERQFA